MSFVGLMFSRKSNAFNNDQILDVNTTTGTTNDTNDTDNSPLDGNEDIEKDSTVYNESILSIDVTKQDENVIENEEGYDIEAQILLLHDMITKKFIALDQKNQQEFDEIKRMLNPTFDSPRRYTKKPSFDMKGPTDDLDVPNIKEDIMNETPHIVIKKNKFKSLLKSLKRKIKMLF